MASCEKCWDDAGLMTFSNPMKGKPEHYYDLIEERKDNPCTPEEQAGHDAKMCPKCNRKTVHQYAKMCVICNSKLMDYE